MSTEGSTELTWDAADDRADEATLWAAELALSKIEEAIAGIETVGSLKLE